MIKISALPTPPTSKDVQSFDIRADAFVEALPRFGEELNAFGEQIGLKMGEIQESINQSQEQANIAIQTYTEEQLELLSLAKDELIKELRAFGALQSEQFINTAQHILLTLRDIKYRRQKEKLERSRIGEYGLFFRHSLPGGYKPAGSVLKISRYPLAYVYFKRTSKILQEDCPRGYFRLPKPNAYAKPTSLAARVGEFENEGLPNITGGVYGISETFQSSGWTSGAFVKRDGYNSNGTPTRTDWTWSAAFDFNASRCSAIYGRTNSVEVNHNLYLEGFYVGEEVM